MVGLFLALLELIRGGLIWANQDMPDGKIYLRSLTSEPAEQAVQNAILKRMETVQHIPIKELPAEKKPESSQAKQEQ